MWTMVFRTMYIYKNERVLKDLDFNMELLSQNMRYLCKVLVIAAVDEGLELSYLYKIITDTLSYKPSDLTKQIETKFSTHYIVS